MQTQCLPDLATFLDAQLNDEALAGARSKVWIWQEECAVVDFVVEGARFGFNFTPAEGGTFDLDFVARNKALSIRLADKKWRGKIPFAKETTREDAWARVRGFVRTISHAGRRQRADQGANAGPKRVGVVTLPLNQNFGGNLQAFALVDTLRRIGCAPVVLDRRMAKKTQAVPPPLPGYAESIALPRAHHNTRFIDRHIGTVSTPLNSSGDLSQAVDVLALDAIIVGSDQVWRPKYAKALLQDFFLSSIPAKPGGPRKVSYAASFGADRWEYSDEQAAMATRALRSFEAVSCREDVGARFIRDHLDHDASHVLDPTLLVPTDRYLEITSSLGRLQSAGKIVTYVLDPNPHVDGILRGIMARKSAPAFMTSGQPYASGNPLSSRTSDNTVERWIAAIAQAGLVVTDSFHGMVFSIMFNRPFVVFANPDRGTARFTSLLRLLDLEERMILGDASPDIDRLLAPIDWDAVNGKLDAARRHSLDFLRDALQLPHVADVDDGNTEVAVATANVTPPSHATLPVLCTGCGACPSEMGASARMEWDGMGFLTPRAPSEVMTAEALRVCPFNPSFDAEDEDSLGRRFLGAATKYHPDAGHYEASFIGHSVEYRATSSSGGIATYIFDKVLQQGLADRLFVVKGDAEQGYSYQSFDRTEDIRSLSKTRYFPVTLAELYREIEATEGTVAVCGVACFVKSVRLKQTVHPELRRKISFIIGIICGGLKSRNYTDYLASSAGITGGYSRQEYRVKNPKSTALDYYFAADDRNGARKRVRMSKMGDMWGSGLFKAKACDFCSDVTTELADLSLGDAWLPEFIRDGLGSSVVIARTAPALALVREGIDAQELSLQEIGVETAVKSQQGGYDHKRRTLKFRYDLAQMGATYQVPHVRPRAFMPISAGEAVVQILRERVRSKSHLNWMATQQASGFDRRMAASRDLLRRVTRMRKKNRQMIEKTTREFLAQPGQGIELKGDMATLGPVVRWARREMSSGRLTSKQIQTLLDA